MTEKGHFVHCKQNRVFNNYFILSTAINLINTSETVSFKKAGLTQIYCTSHTYVNLSIKKQILHYFIEWQSRTDPHVSTTFFFTHTDQSLHFNTMENKSEKVKIIQKQILLHDPTLSAICTDWRNPQFVSPIITFVCKISSLCSVAGRCCIKRTFRKHGKHRKSKCTGVSK